MIYPARISATALVNATLYSVVVIRLQLVVTSVLLEDHVRHIIPSEQLMAAVTILRTHSGAQLTPPSRELSCLSTVTESGDPGSAKQVTLASDWSTLTNSDL